MPPLIGLGRAILAALPVRTLFRDFFATAKAAPVGTVNADPGPGQWQATDTNGIMSVSGGTLNINGTPAVSDGVMIMQDGSERVFPYRPGFAVLITFAARTTNPVNSVFFGLSALAGLAGNPNAISILFSSPTVVTLRFSTGAVWTYTIGSGAYQFMLVRRSHRGYMILGRAVGTTPWTVLLMEDSPGAGVAYVKARLGVASAMNFKIDDLRIIESYPLLSTNNTPSGSMVPATAAGDSGTHAPDFYITFSIVAQTGVTQQFWIRRTNANNGWIASLDEPADTIKLIERVAGVDTERSSATQTQTNGTTYTTQIVGEGTTIKTAVARVSKNSYAAATSNQTATGWYTSHGTTQQTMMPGTITLPEVP